MAAALTLDAVRVRSPGSAGPAVRRAVARQLDGTEIAPAGMPPAAVLIVRRMADPLPGRFRRRASVPRPRPEWERAARTRLEELHRAAARPAGGPVLADAPAVLFADPAELLACLARDLLAGRHRELWWWRAVLRARPEVTRGGLAALLRGELELVPAVLALLHRRGEAEAAVEALRPDAAAQLLHDLLPELAARPLLPRGLQPAAGTSPAGPEPGPEGGPDLAARSAPWSAWWEERAPRPAGREARCLLGVALALHHAPARARSRRFAEEVRRWWRSRSSGEPALLDSESRRRGPAASSAAEPTAESPPPLSTPAGPSRPKGDPGGDGQDRSGTAASRASAATAAPPVAPLEAVAGEPPTEPPGPLEPGPGPEAGVETGLAGVFYLVSAMVDLQLLPRLGRALGPADELGGWGVLALLARHLLAGGLPDGASGESSPVRSWEEDPLWTVLAALDGREPGEPPERPPRRLRPRLRAWLDGVREETACRLAEAGLDAGFLLAPGRVHVTPSHVDVVIPIDRISLPVRRAGLDRDPGWVPELGRIVLFHFD